MVDFKTGDTVTFASGTEGNSTSGYYYGTKRFRKGDTALVTRVGKNRLTVRTKFNGEDASFNVNRSVLETPNGETYEPKVSNTRPIGQVPEDGIAPDDPRLQWLWEDGARLAKNYGLCYDYDRLVERLGIPGRLRDITVVTTVGGIKISATVKARSEKEAKELIASKVAAE